MISQLSRIALYLNLVLQNLKTQPLINGHVPLVWLTGDGKLLFPMPPTSPAISEETQVLFVQGENRFWIANNSDLDSDLLHRFLAFLGINDFTSLMDHVNAYGTAILARHGSNIYAKGRWQAPVKGVPKRGEVSEPVVKKNSKEHLLYLRSKEEADAGNRNIEFAPKFAKRPDSRSSITGPMGPSVSSGISTHSVPSTPGISNTSSTSSISSTSVPSGASTSTVPATGGGGSQYESLRFGVIQYKYRAASGDKYHAEQQLLAAFSELDKRTIRGKTVYITGCKGACTICEEVISRAARSLREHLCFLVTDNAESVRLRNLAKLGDRGIVSGLRRLHDEYFPTSDPGFTTIVSAPIDGEIAALSLPAPLLGIISGYV
jgi:hypothetical protein